MILQSLLWESRTTQNLFYFNLLNARIVFMRAFFILIYLLFMNFLKCPCIIISARAIFISIIIFFEEELLGKVLPQTPSQNFLSYISYNKSPCR